MMVDQTLKEGQPDFTQYGVGGTQIWLLQNPK